MSDSDSPAEGNDAAGSKGGSSVPEGEDSSYGGSGSSTVPATSTETETDEAEDGALSISQIFACLL
jgi:hypothetical protein